LPRNETAAALPPFHLSTAAAAAAAAEQEIPTVQVHDLVCACVCVCVCVFACVRLRVGSSVNVFYCLCSLSISVRESWVPVTYHAPLPPQNKAPSTLPNICPSLPASRIPTLSRPPSSSPSHFKSHARAHTHRSETSVLAQLLHFVALVLLFAAMQVRLRANFPPPLSALNLPCTPLLQWTHEEREG
jgi:hypothetical protein